MTKLERDVLTKWLRVRIKQSIRNAEYLTDPADKVRQSYEFGKVAALHDVANMLPRFNLLAEIRHAQEPTP